MLVCLGLHFAWLSAAHAGLIIDQVVINAGDGSDTGSIVLNIPLSADDIQYDLPAPVEIFSSTNVNKWLGTLTDLSLVLENDPSVTLGFNVTAGSSATHFTIDSAVLSFPTISNSLAFASAAITVTDNDGDGATATGTFAGGTKAYAAIYNGATLFANLVDQVTADPDSSNTGSQRVPVTGNTLIGAVSSMESHFDFVLTANDQASATSRFNVVPEPGSPTLAASGALALAWGIRRRLRAR